jgi:hypothetical protein
MTDTLQQSILLAGITAGTALVLLLIWIRRGAMTFGEYLATVFIGIFFSCAVAMTLSALTRALVVAGA